MMSELLSNWHWLSKMKQREFNKITKPILLLFKRKVFSKTLDCASVAPSIHTWPNSMGCFLVSQTGNLSQGKYFRLRRILKRNMMVQLHTISKEFLTHGKVDEISMLNLFTQDTVYF